jgi:hypothetical protein
MSLQESFDSELLQREAIEAGPTGGASAVQCGAQLASNTLTARSEPYNRTGSHAKSVIDGAESFAHR